jgi:flagellar basal-body rod protein FlgF
VPHTGRTGSITFRHAMQPSPYVSLSGQIALQKRLETVAHNVANAGTAGFRAEEIRFEAVLSEAARDPVAYASTGDTYLSRRSGSLAETGNPLDVAVRGNAFLAMATPAGQVYTRDGRLRIGAEGELQTLNGHAILDAGGAPMQLDPNGGEVKIAPDGAITQEGRRVGALGMFTLSNDATLTRYENSGVTSNIPAEPALDVSRNSMVQGFVEQANVEPVSEITKLITISRSFEAVTNALEQIDSQQRDSIRTLGPTS